MGTRGRALLGVGVLALLFVGFLVRPALPSRSASSGTAYLTGWALLSVAGDDVTVVVAHGACDALSSHVVEDAGSMRIEVTATDTSGGRPCNSSLLTDRVVVGTATPLDERLLFGCDPQDLAREDCRTYDPGNYARNYVGIERARPT